MLKAVVAATAAVTIAGSTVAFAQRDERPDGARRWQQSTTEDMRAFQAARLAALRAGLALTADQEKHWPAFEQAMRELQQLRLNTLTADRVARRDGGTPITDPAELMRQRAQRLSESGAVLKRLADATEPLYRSLDEAQRRRFAVLTRTEGPRGRHHRGRDGREPGTSPRGWHRTDATPAEIPPDTRRSGFPGKTVDGSWFAQAFVGKTIDGYAVGRVFGTKSVNGDLAIGELTMLPQKSPFVSKTVGTEPGTFGRKISIVEPVFGRKVATSI